MAPVDLIGVFDIDEDIGGTVSSSITNELKIAIGQSKTWKLTARRPNRSPINLTGAVVHWRLKRVTSDETVLISKSSVVAAEILITNALKGKADIFLVPADTKPVDGTGTVTTPAGALLVDGETFVIDDGNGPVTFEFDDDATIVAGNVIVSFTAADTADVVRDAIIDAINGATDFAIAASVGGAGLVNLVNDIASFDHNIAITEAVADAGFVVTGMAGNVKFDSGVYVYDCWVVLADLTEQPVIFPTPFKVVQPVTEL